MNYELWKKQAEGEPVFIGYSRATNFTEAVANKLGVHTLDRNEDESIKMVDGFPSVQGEVIYSSKEAALTVFSEQKKKGIPELIEHYKDVMNANPNLTKEELMLMVESYDKSLSANDINTIVNAVLGAEEGAGSDIGSGGAQGNDGAGNSGTSESESGNSDAGTSGNESTGKGIDETGTGGDQSENAGVAGTDGADAKYGDTMPGTPAIAVPEGVTITKSEKETVSEEPGATFSSNDDNAITTNGNDSEGITSDTTGDHQHGGDSKGVDGGGNQPATHIPAVDDLPGIDGASELQKEVPTEQVPLVNDELKSDNQ